MIFLIAKKSNKAFAIFFSLYKSGDEKHQFSMLKSKRLDLPDFRVLAVNSCRIKLLHCLSKKMFQESVLSSSQSCVSITKVINIEVQYGFEPDYLAFQHLIRLSLRYE